MPGRRQSLDYAEVRRAFEGLWTQRTLPLDCRRVICGAVQAGARKQGDQVFDERYMEKVHREEPLDPDEQRDMFEKVHKFVLIDNALRVQYLTIVLRITTNYLARHYQHLAKAFELKVEDAAAQSARNN